MIIHVHRYIICIFPLEQRAWALLHGGPVAGMANNLLMAHEDELVPSWAGFHHELFQELVPRLDYLVSRLTHHKMRSDSIDTLGF